VADALRPGPGDGPGGRPTLVIDPTPPPALAAGPWDEARTWAARRSGWSLAPGPGPATGRVPDPAR
jgi:hypothetical protein